MHPATAVGVTGAGPVTVRRAPRLVGAAYALVLTVCTAVTLVWLGLGAVVAAAAHLTPVADALATGAASGNAWARAALGSIPRSEPTGQVLLDYAFSVAAAGVAVAMLISRRSGWPGRLLALALVASAGAFNLQAQAAAATVQLATGLGVGGVEQILLQSVACAAYVSALLVFPSGEVGARARGVVAAAGAGTLVLVGTATALLAHTLTCVIFFGVGVPLAGIAVLRRRVRSGSSVAERTQSRLLFSMMMAALVVAIALVTVTVLLTALGWDGLTLADPTGQTGSARRIGGSQPLALLFWYARLVCVAIAVAALVATRSAALWSTERWFSRGLVLLLVAALVGGCYFVIDTVADVVLGPARAAAAVAVTAVATAVAALAFRPVHRCAERLLDRVLFGSRPTPYSVLADIAAVSTASAADAPDLERVAEAVGRGLSATTCRLTAVRPGLRDRTYTWAKRRAHASDELLEVPIRHGEVPIGAIAVDHAAVAGLQAQRRRLLEDIADSLGAVLQTSRLGIELERQLRAALAHAAEIAGARRSAVAEMDRERRRIERNLHDGAQHHLVSLRLTLGLVEHQVAAGRPEQVRDQLDRVLEQIDMAESVLAETAAGVSSPLLAQRGLVGALRTELAAGQPPVILDAEGVTPGLRFPADVEAATYFCCLEAVNNARKHAPGAAISVCLSAAGGRLHLCVRDDGPGWDAAAAPTSPGQGMRNVAARIEAVGGRVEVRSAPGSGATVACSVPVPGDPAPARADGSAGRTGGGPATAAVPRAPRSPGLLDDVRRAADVAADLYRGTRQAEPLRLLRQRLDGPVRVAVVAAPGVEAGTLVDALRRLTARSTDVSITLVDPAPAGGRAAGGAEQADALVLLRHAGSDGAAPPPAHRAGRDGPRILAVPVRAGDPAGRAERDPAARLAHRGVPGLHALVDARFVQCARALKARSALRSLEGVVLADPPGIDGRQLVYLLERIRVEAHAFTEMDLVDALEAGGYDLSDADRAAAGRMLGGSGTDPRTRLSLAPDSSPDDVVRAAARQLRYWQQRTRHPAAAAGVRAVGPAVVRTCEQVLGLVAGATRSEAPAGHGRVR